MSFLDNYDKLKKSIPVPAVHITTLENCELVDYTHHSKDCYKTFVTMSSERCMYLDDCGMNKDVVDGVLCAFSELCYENVDSLNCYNCSFLDKCHGCKDSRFSFMCNNCSDCFGCVALTSKQYCIFNKQYTKEEYFKEVERLKQQDQESILSKLSKIKKGVPIPASTQQNNENCLYGDFINNSKNTYWAFDAFWAENSGYLFFSGKVRDCWDVTYGGGGTGKQALESYSEGCYEVAGGANIYNCFFIELCINSSDCMYSSRLQNCTDCFGCVGLSNKQYCVLNNQLTKEEYQKAVTFYKKELGWQK